MTKDTITINKNLIPYSFDIELGSEIFTLSINYNNVGEFFTVGLNKNETVICAGEPIVYGIPLFRDVYSSEVFPAVDIIPLSLGNTHDSVTFDNLSETVFLLIDNDSTSILGSEDNE